MLIGSIVSFCVAQAAMILDRAVSLDIRIRVILILAALLGWALFTLQLLLIFRTGRELLDHPDTQTALNDELVRQNRLKAMAAGFWAAILCQGVLFIANLILPFDAGIGSQITITVAVAGMIGAFLHYDREGEDA
jgi:hypothetical protein